jgi:tetratricopeptide (TPR) repeat protein
MKSRSLAMAIILPLLYGGAISSVAQTGSKEKTAKETMQYVGQGSAAYLKQDYKKAIQLYGRALELEKKEPTLEKNIWRVLVDNLGMSYGISGDNKKAKEIFEYGLSKDDTYPMFYYNLACAYPEMNDLDNAITNLKSAFEHKKNMISGERIPDPATDDSFARFLKNEKFRRALDDLRSK